MGSAPCLETDLGQLPCPLESCTVFAVNEAGLRYLGHIHHWVSLHPNYFQPPPQEYGFKDVKEWEFKRWELGGNKDYLRHSHIQLRGCVDMQHKLIYGGGSSSFFAVQVAKEQGFRKIIICGVLLNDLHYPQYQQDWKDHFSEIEPICRGMSGFPAELLGRPTKEWLSK